MGMSIEQKIMSTVVQADMFLLNTWKVMLVVLILLFGITLLILLRQ